MLSEILRKLFLIENYDLKSEYCWAYAIINFLIAALVLIVYYFSKDRIRSSARSSAQLTDYQNPKGLLNGAKLYLFSILSIPILNFISNLSGLMGLGGFLTIGFGSIFGVFILVFLVHGLYGLVMELFDINDLPGNSFINNHSKIHVIFGSILVLTLLINLIFVNETYLGHLIILFTILYLLATGMNMYYLHYLSWISNPDPVKKIRFRLIILNYFILIFALIFELLIRTQSADSAIWLEELGFLLDGVVILFLLNFYLMIFLPETFRKIIKIPNQELALYKDMRIDVNTNLYKWYQLSLEALKKEESAQLHQSNFVIFHSFLKEDQDPVCKALTTIFNTQFTMNPSSYAEPFFNREILPNSNLFFLIDPVDPFLDKILDRIYLDYNFRIEFCPNLCINDFEYKEIKEKFIPFLITPLINLETGVPVVKPLKSWTIIAEEEYHQIISEFIDNYYPYFETVSRNKVLICVLIFPIVDGKICNIPSGAKSNWPNFKNLIFL